MLIGPESLNNVKFFKFHKNKDISWRRKRLLSLFNVTLVHDLSRKKRSLKVEQQSLWFRSVQYFVLVTTINALLVFSLEVIYKELTRKYREIFCCSFPCVCISENDDSEFQ